MGIISPSLPVTGSPNSTEDPKVLGALTAILGVLNGNVDSANLADNAVGAAEIAPDSVGASELVDFYERAPAYSVAGKTIRAGYVGGFHAGGGWLTTTYSLGFTMTSIDFIVVNPHPQVNGASLQGWSLAGWTTSGFSLFQNNSAAQSIPCTYFLIGTA